MAEQRPISADEVARRSFGTAFRGFDQLEVRAFLGEIAAELAAAHERERNLREALATAEAKVGPAELDEAALDAVLGQEAGKVLAAARQAAAEIRSRAEEQVGRLVREATEQAAATRAQADGLLATRTSEAEAAAAAIREEAARNAEKAVEQAQHRGREMVAEAQAVRERVLKDLSRRRRHAHQQLEQLRAGRERLLDAYRVVRTTLDEATRELTVAEAEARAAAETAALRAGGHEESVEELEAEVAAARDAGLTLAVLQEPAAPTELAPAGNAAEGGEPGGEGADAVVDVRSEVAEPEPEEAEEPAGGAGGEEPVEVGAGGRPATSERRPPATPRRAVPPARVPRRLGNARTEVTPLSSDDIEGVRILGPARGEPAAAPEPAEAAGDGAPGAPAEAEADEVPVAAGADEVPAAVGTDDAATQDPPAAAGGEPVAAARGDQVADVSEAEAAAADEVAPPAEVSPPAESDEAAEVAEVAEAPAPEQADDVEEGEEPAAEGAAPSGGAAGDGGQAEAEADSEAAADREAGGDSDGEATGAGVDQLFARIRADRQAAVARAEAVLADGGGGVPAVTEAAERDPATEEAAEAAEPVAPEAPAGEEGAGAPVGVDDEAALERRDLVVEPLERALAKALKRSLADEQNEVLDALRRLRGAPTLDALLPSPEEHAARHARVAAGPLLQAAELGRGDSDAPVEVGDLAERLAVPVADDLRSRLARAIDDADGDDEALVEAISAAYRQWKSSRVAPLARHHVVEAHARGRFAGLPDGPLRWVVDRAGACGPDCDDNALAGEVAKGEAFPTGHLHPPAHPACRCLVVTPMP